MSALIRAYDWSATPLGPIAGWPPSLRTAINLMLNASHPMWIGWGPHATFLYNDAYLSVLGEAKHPWALGRPAAEVWSEIWDVCGPLADKVFRHGEASFVDDVRLLMRRGQVLEETFYSFSYSPIRDESGRIAGLFCPSTETTAKVLTTRRLATLSNLAAKALVEKTIVTACRTAMQTIAQNPDDIPFALFYLIEGGRLVLRERAGLAADHPLAPAAIALDSTQSPWPVSRALCEATPIDCPVARELAIAPVAGQPVSEAVVMPVISSGDQRPVGVLILAASATRKLDTEYRTFFTLVASQLAIAIANATAYEEERRRAEALAELDRAKTVFFSNISHELRTPLTLVLGPLNDAIAGVEDPTLRDALQLAQRNARRLQKLVNTLLDFSRIQAGRAHAQYERVDVGAFTAELAATFRSAVERAGLRFDVDCPACEAYVDLGMWEKIVLNLLSNAFKFTFEGAIKVRVAARDGAFELTVADSGVGIPQGELPKLFERFHRVEGARSRNHEGSGIGLALVHELVKLHGGRIAVSSSEGGGSTFTVSVPLGAAHLPKERVVSGTQRPASMAPVFVDEASHWLASDAEAAPQSAPDGKPRPVVLVADDNADMRDYLRRLLQPHYDVVTAADGDRALEIAATAAPHLVLTDVMMPGKSGFDLLHSLRASAATRDLPIILLSARAGEEARVEGLKAGADEYLVKPFSARELMARIESQLKLARLRREASEERQTLYEIARSLASDLDLATLVQKITDAGTQLSKAKFGAFFYNGVDEQGEAYTLYTLSGAPREAFAKFGHPRPTPVFGPTFKGEGTIRSADIKSDPRYGQWGPHHGQPPGHLPVRSYLAVPVVSRSGAVLGGLFFGHPDVGIFDERAERAVEALAGHAAAAIDNARLYAQARRSAEERRELLESERSARAEAERLNAGKDEFVATLSHELRTPLNSILGWSQILERSDLQADEVRQAAEVIRRNARAQAQLIDDLLDITRITSGKLRLDVQSVSPHAFIEAAVDALRPAAAAREIRVSVVVDPRAGPISGDPNRLQQVIWNLLSNAIKFTDRGGKVQVLLERVNSHIQISVADTGQGIEPDFLPHVFERFRQQDASSTRKYGGLGLGLAIVKHLVELHGGSVSVASAGLGQGTTFTVRLPLSVMQRAEADERQPANRSSPSVMTGNVNLAGTRILVVDDDMDARHLVSRVLQDVGAHVIHASDGEQALSLVDSHAFDVLISDIGMPKMDGYELMRQLRQRKDVASAIRPIALTAFARSQDRTRALLAGFVAHLSKPVEAAELLATIAAVTGRASGNDP